METYLASDRSVLTPELPAATHDRGKRFLWIVCLLWIVALGIVCVRVGFSPQRQSVYAADYVPAGWHWLHGQEIYYRRHHFIYSPLVAAAFAPFSALPAGLSGILWRLISVAVFLAAGVAWLRSGLSGLDENSASAGNSRLVTIACLLLLPLAVGNVNLGQMNLLVLAATAGGILAVRQRRWNIAALIFAAAGFTKIYPLAIGLLLASLYPRQLSGRLALALVGLFILSLGLQRPAYALGEYRQWAAVLGRDDRMDVDLYASWRDFGYLLRACGVPLPERIYRVMEAAAGGALAIFLWLGKWRWAWPEARVLGGAFALGCAWMVLFGPATESATYVLLSLPLCAALVASWPPKPATRSSGSMALPVLFMSCYALLIFAEITSAWFHASTHHLYMRALQPVAALAFAVGTIGWLVHSPKVPMPPSLT